LPKTKKQQVSTVTAVALVVANMIGTGVFTSLGFQLNDMDQSYAVLSLWVLGGILALAGAFSYVEIGTYIKKSGGEYTFISSLYSPFMGYLAGWVSLTVGFAAPVALSAIAVVAYFPFWNIPPVWGSLFIVAAITCIHSISVKSSSLFQNGSTLLKVVLILVLIGIGLATPSTAQNFITNGDYTTQVLSSAFAVALVYVSYSYSGWNAAVYITEEIKNPKKSLPFALVGGTLLVTILYTALNYIFLKHVPIQELKGQVDVGAIATTKMLGNQAGTFFSLAISLLLISGVSAMVWIGPRVTASMAENSHLWRFFKTEPGTVPLRALWLQFALTALLLITGTFEQILIYCGFLLTLSSLFTVMGVFKVRKKQGNISDNFKSPLFPLLQIIFMVFSIGMVIFLFVERPKEAGLGLINLVLGALIWYLDQRLGNKTSRIKPT